MFKVKVFLKSLVDWQSLGLALGLLYPSLEIIEREQRGLVEQCKTKMLAAWLQQQDNVCQNGVPSWAVLQTALEEIGERQLASEISTHMMVSYSCHCTFVSVVSYVYRMGVCKCPAQVKT